MKGVSLGQAPALPANTILESLARDKHSSLYNKMMFLALN
jgi:hypothetical protein